MLPVLLLTALGALTATAIPTTTPVDAVSVLSARAVSPDQTCGNLKAGANKGYTCPGTAACCSSYGYCGTASDFCLTTAGCQTQFSNSSSACHAPKSGVDVTIDGTCGSTGVGKLGYRCAANGTFSACCSSS
ncbi:hypothetical protein B0T18DRAFT_196227 [Schizothecium vesticola]|uniref:Chitin-binding type-1 domain-containing protein n=1 Tax=Schizothecium vesticola TaxID=314040 RepID=A0AA40K344_9PEZI|nr:hypothetical protein B0T18DRAFT_196227 [Schizothecium vesticola]